MPNDEFTLTLLVEIKKNMQKFFIHLLLIVFFGVLSVPTASALGEQKKFVLVIDPGHGGKDYGAIGKRTNEKTINLKIALEFGRLVKANCPDVKVVYTRSTDKFVSLQRRADIANNNHADLFVSIHTNALPRGKIAYGTETYTLGIARAESNLEVAKRENAVITYEDDYQTTYQGFDPNKPESYIIFELMQDKYMEQSVDMARCVQNQYTQYAGRKNKGVKQAGFLVLRATSMPAILTEVGFISTPAEERFLSSKEGVQKMGKSLYKGFLAYKKSKTAVVANPPIEEVQIAEQPAPQPQRQAEEPSEAKQKPAQEKAQPKKPVAKQTKPVFKVQILTANKVLKTKDKRFKNVAPVDHYKEGGIYKYTHGNSTNYAEIKKLQKQLNKKFPGCFIVAFKNGQRMNLHEAIQQSKQK